MGGTTAKICLIDNGEPLKARTFEVDRQSRFKRGSGIPVRIPVIEMVEIGAGGGSIARIDALGRIEVGPDSAGAEPGPVCYGHGGREPTVTDADLSLGKIDPQRFAGGKIAIHPDKAAAALAAGLGGLTAEQAALGIAEIVDENMANAARVHAVERGVAIAERTLIAFGGAAPLHASRLAEKLNIKRVIVPANAGVGSALGFLAAPAAFELVCSRYMRLGDFDAEAATALIASMEKEVTAHCRAAAAGRPLAVKRSAFMRYAGQGHEIAVALPDGPMTPAHGPRLRAAFEREYARLFARHIPGAAIEVMSWMVLATTPAPPPMQLAAAAPCAPPGSLGKRSILDARLGRRIAVPVFERDRLAPGAVLEGPALIVEADTSTYVSPSFAVQVDSGGALVLTTRRNTG
jgi:N-methylhydantoinase A